MFFWVLWGFDAVITLVILYFFLIGLADGSVSSSNGGIWFVLLAVLGLILGGSLWLRAQNHVMLAKLVLWLLAVPGLLYVLFMLFVIIAKPRWN